MKARANTRIDIIGGTTVDSFGDPKDLGKQQRTGVTASIIERTKTVTNPDDGSTRVVRFYVGRVPSGTPITSGERIRDQRDSAIYIVDAVSQSRNAVRGDDIRLDLRRVS